MLVLAGLEPEGRAGLLADVEAIRAQGAHPVAVATALTAQGERTFRAQTVPPAMLAAQMRAALELGTVHAVKVGMLPDARAVRKVRARALANVPWVVDPVVRTSLGQRLSTLKPRDYLALAGPRVVITPNALEAAWLLGRREIAPELAAERLVALGFGAAVVKGGHLRGRAVDVVADREGVARLDGPRLKVEGKRGTGCRFASAMAARMAQGASAREAAAAAKDAVARYLLGA
ncbi:MAG TPA: bifunctional hydroxymethylpyrimidine kinase/phosphomethylpyrimidine kinase [Myxococcaceae bacterium]|nr:bifunctional hydroxymethylpyrimidine kinase/phosphomethylpyrimidine kinase [Myxococcaceae bacterium]